MVSISALPDHALVKVFRHFIRKEQGSLTKLKGWIPLLAVCRRWRWIAQSLAHRYVHVRRDVRRKPPPIRGGLVRRTGPLNLGSLGGDDTTFGTNIDIIASSGCSTMARRVDIYLRCRSSPIPALLEIAKRMDAAPEGWGRVKGLRITTHLDSCGVGWFARSSGEVQQNARTACAALTKQLPGVRQLSLLGANNSVIVQQLYGQLASVYYNQLDAFCASGTISLPLGSQPLQTAELVLHAANCRDPQLPRVDSSKLKMLYLWDWPLDHSWAALRPCGDTSADIVFPNLDQLSLTYDTPRVANGVGAQYRDGHLWRLHFPHLNTAYIQCRADFCPFLDYAILPERMLQLEVSVKATLLRRIADVKLPAATLLQVDLHGDAEDVPYMFAAIRSIMGTAEQWEGRCLVLRPTNFVIASEYFMGINLTRLVVFAPTGFSAPIGIVEAIPTLRLLVLDHLTPDGAPDDISELVPHDHVPIAPLNTKLETLEIKFRGPPCPLERVTQLVMYLVLKIQSLQHLRVDLNLHPPLREFAHAYATWYPHLASISLAVREFASYHSEELEYIPGPAPGPLLS